MFKKIFAVFILITISVTCFADMVQCPNGTQFVQVGAPMDQVFASCGQPQKIVKSYLTAPKKEIWTYNFSGILGGVNSNGFQLGFENGILKNINIQSVATATISPQQSQLGYTQPAQSNTATLPQGPSLTLLMCPTFSRGTITLGMSQDQVKQNCGDPNSVQQINSGDDQNTQKEEVVQFIYQAQPYLQPSTLTFKDGKLLPTNP